MPDQISTAIESWALRTPFRISRGIRTESQIVVFGITRDGVTGRGEGAITPRYGESVEQVAAEAQRIAGALADGISRDELRQFARPGSARNAADCAIWDLESKLRVIPTSNPIASVITAITIGIDTPERMAESAARIHCANLIKVKVDGRDPEACLRAVRSKVPNARMIVDANESWSMAQVEAMQPILDELGIELLEQPLPAAEDRALEGFRSLVPICADESCHIAADVDHLKSRYSYVNIKLDKTGGLTEAFDLYAQARATGLGVMVGCMISTSLAIAATIQVAARADFADLDGPWWLKEDRVGGIQIDDYGQVTPPDANFWGPRGLISI